MKLTSINPATGELIETFDEISDADLEAALQRARQTFRTYRSTSFAERAGWLQRAAQILENESDTWARMMTREMGKTYKAALAEAQKCASGCRYFAENGARFLADEAIKTEADDSYVRYLPLGPILAVMPWELPVLASGALCGSGVDGGQCRDAQARLQRVALRPRPARDLPPRRLPRRRVSDPAHELQACRPRDRG